METIKLIRIKTLCSVEISPSESSLRGHQGPVLSIDSAGHALHVFVNGKFIGNPQAFPFLITRNMISKEEYSLILQKRKNANRILLTLGGMFPYYRISLWN